MLSSRFAGIPISSSIIDEARSAAVAEPRGANVEAVTGSGGRLHFGMVAGIKSERWPTSNRNAWPDCLGIRRLPRHLDIDRTSDREIQEIVLTTNLTPRKCLGFKTPFQALLAELGKDVQIRFS